MAMFDDTGGCVPCRLEGIHIRVWAFHRLWYVPPFLSELSVVLVVTSFFVKQMASFHHVPPNSGRVRAYEIWGQCARKDCRIELGYLLFSKDSLLRTWALLSVQHHDATDVIVSKTLDFHPKTYLKFETPNRPNSPKVCFWSTTADTKGDWHGFEFARWVLWTFVGILRWHAVLTRLDMLGRSVVCW